MRNAAEQKVVAAEEQVCVLGDSGRPGGRRGANPADV